jgi:hypothetical protein
MVPSNFNGLSFHRWTLQSAVGNSKISHLWKDGISKMVPSNFNGLSFHRWTFAKRCGEFKDFPSVEGLPFQKWYPQISMAYPSTTPLCKALSRIKRFSICGRTTFPKMVPPNFNGLSFHKWTLQSAVENSKIFHLWKDSLSKNSALKF